MQANNKLLFINMTLKARLDIRNFFLKNTVREIYENVGQVLSVVRMQLEVLDANDNPETHQSVHSPGHLVAQSIRDLRAMCKSFYPDADIIKDEGFNEAFVNTIQILFRNTKPVIKIKGVRKDIQPELKLIIFKIMLEVLTAIKEMEGENPGLSISYTKEEIQLTVSYKGKEITLDTEIADGVPETGLTLVQGLQIIGGKFNVIKSKTGTVRIKLISPLKSLLL